MAPYALLDLLGKPLTYAIYLGIGVAFGAVLEMAGFANSRRLAAQFYLRDMTVLKVMFTGIVVAMVLTFLASGLGWLDFERVWVPPTYLVPGLVGGLLMGVGFILGGFCPGTSLVAVATLKLDALVFFIGVSLGVMGFGESVGRFPGFFHGSSFGRLTLPDWLGVPTGWVVLGVTLMALGMFWAAERLETAFGGRSSSTSRRVRRAGVPAVLGVAVVVLVVGQPTSLDRWNALDPARHAALESRSVFVHPGELIDTAADRTVRMVVLDVRDEDEFNVFHLVGAERVALAELASGVLPLALLQAPETVTVVVSNDERRATQAWKLLVAGGVVNAYVLEGGINGWLEVVRPRGAAPDAVTGTLRHRFTLALGDRHPEANPERYVGHALPYEKRIQLQTRRALGGGCG